jgi:hypothetical protein
MLGVANQGTSQAQHVTRLPFHKLSAGARQADTFQDFPTLLMSMGKTSDNGTISVFTKNRRLCVQREECTHHMQGQAHPYWRARWKGTIPNTVDATTGTVATKDPIKTSAESTTTGQQHLQPPINQQAIKWMHALCGYPVKSTWLKAIKAGNYVGWPMLMELNVQKYYPQATKTAKGHVNQTRKNVRSTKVKPAPLETCNTLQLHGKKVCNVYTETYKVRKTMFSD